MLLLPARRVNAGMPQHTLRVRLLGSLDMQLEDQPLPPLRWRPDAPLWLDVEQFERAVADGRPAEAVPALA